MTPADTLADLAEHVGWTITEGPTKYGVTTRYYSTATHELITWWQGDTFDTAHLYRLGEGFRKVAATGNRDVAYGWLAAHGTLEAAS